MRQGSSTGSRTMVQRHGIARDLTVCGLFTALTAVGAFIKIVIPVGADTMNFTLQWFFVLLAGLLLGSRRAFLSVSTYLLIGLVGIPVFARGGGPSYLIRPTFGFLLGFALAAYVMGKIVEWMHASKPGACLFSATVGYVIYYGMGILYFYFITHFGMGRHLCGILPAHHDSGLYTLHSCSDGGRTPAPVYGAAYGVTQLIPFPA